MYIRVIFSLIFNKCSIILPVDGFPATEAALGFVAVFVSLLLKRKRNGSLRPISFPIAKSSIFSTNV